MSHDKYRKKWTEDVAMQRGGSAQIHRAFGMHITHMLMSDAY